jgi:hypothetical protein
MILFTNILMCALGVLFIAAAFLTTGIRGAFSKGPYRPITKTGRVIIFTTGVVLLGSGVQRLLH